MQGCARSWASAGRALPQAATSHVGLTAVDPSAHLRT